MLAGEEFAHEHKADEILLHVFAAKADANHLYKKLGYQTRKEFYSRDGKLTSRRIAKKVLNN